MKKLIIVRHGSYSTSTGKLIESGHSQMKRLAEVLRPMVKNYTTTIILSSSAPRAVESAKMLGGSLGVIVEEYMELWSDENREPDYDKATAIIKTRNAIDIVIIMTHHEYVHYLPSDFARQELKVDLSSCAVNNGEGWVLDLKKKRIQRISLRA